MILAYITVEDPQHRQPGWPAREPGGFHHRPRPSATERLAMPTNIKYATYPTARVFENKGDTRNIHELLWGDWVRVTGPKSGGWYPVRARGLDGFMKADDLQDERLLEVVFIDVGQGDGCLLVTPKDKHLLVDAGMRGNMYRFLRWRYAGFKKKWRFESVIITHPDSDHYSGFSELFDEENVSVGTLYHNGIIETSATTRGRRRTATPWY